MQRATAISVLSGARLARPQSTIGGISSAGMRSDNNTSLPPGRTAGCRIRAMRTDRVSRKMRPERSNLSEKDHVVVFVCGSRREEGEKEEQEEKEEEGRSEEAKEQEGMKRTL